MAEAKAATTDMNQELDDAVQKGMAAEERLAHLDAALKDCIQQISILQEERELQEELKEANTRLIGSLLCKQELVEELERDKLHLEAELDALIARVDSVEKENAFLKCECCALERELVMHLESAKKIATLEDECQQLRHLVQRKLQGHVNDHGNSKRRLNFMNGALVANDNSSRKINILVDRLCDVEEENQALREIITARENELCSSKLKCAQVAYRLAVIEAELKDVSEGDRSKLLDQQRARSCLDNSRRFEINGSELCTGAFPSELECFPNSDEKNQLHSVQHGTSKNSLMNHFMNDSEHQLESISNQIVPVLQAHTKERSTEKHGNWPWNVLDMILDEHRVSKRSINDHLEEIKISLAPQSSLETSGLLTWAQDQANLLEETRAKQSESNLNRSICRMVELLEEISPSSLVGSSTTEEDQCPTSTKWSDANLDYSVHVFRWRNSELMSILRKFVLSCSLVLSGGHGLEDFAMQLTAMLEWAVENCITLEDASHVREKIRKHFRLDRSKSEGELEVTSGDCQHVMTKMIKIQCDLKEENTRLTHKLRSLESGNEELETRLRLSGEHNEHLMIELEESKESLGRLQEEVEYLKESKGVIEDQIENQKLINEDLDTQLTVAKVKQNEIMQKLSCLEVELEDKNQCCEELEATCLELQLQLEILSRRGSPQLEEDGTEKNALTGWELIPCDELAEYQDTGMEKELTNTFNDHENANQHYSLRDRMLADDDDAKTKEIVCVGDMEKEKQPIKHDPDMGAAGALAVVPGKKPGRGGFGFIKKLFLRRKKCSSKNASTLLQRNASTMMR